MAPHGKGCDQTHCQDRPIIRCDMGYCNQAGATTTSDSYDPTTDAGSILCGGGHCDMTGAQSKTFFARMACDGGNCGMKNAKAETFSCLKGGCDFTGITGPSWFSESKQTSYDCNGGHCCLPEKWTVDVFGTCGSKACDMDATTCKSCSPRASGCGAPGAIEPYVL